MTDQQKSEIQQMRHAGMAYPKIAGALGLPLNTVKSYGHRYNLQSDSHDGSTRRCRQCGTEYPQPKKRKPKLFCSDRCRLQWWHRNKALSSTASEVVCPGCGQKFRATPRQKYCGHPCYVAARFGGEVHG